MPSTPGQSTTLTSTDPETRPEHRLVRRAAPAIAAYFSIRLLGLLAIVGWAARSGTDPFGLLSRRWDAVWYASIAQHGYQRVVQTPDGPHSDYAFFPLYPALIRAVDTVTPLDAPTAGLVLSWLAGLVAAAGIYAVGERLFDRRVGLLLVVLWAAFPVAIVQSMAYTEALFTALTAWTLYAVLTRRWLWAAGLCVLAGLTRPTGLALAGAVCLAALVLVIRDWRRTGRLDWRPIVGGLLAPLGFASYVGWVGLRTGSPTGYFEAQSDWGNRIDFGVSTARGLWRMLTGPTPVLGVLLVGMLAAVLVLLGLCVRQRQPLVVLVFCVGVVALALMASGYFSSRPRMLLPAFPLLLPPAVALARLRTPAAVAISIGLAAVAAFYGVYMLLLSPAPP